MKSSATIDAIKYFYKGGKTIPFLDSKRKQEFKVENQRTDRAYRKFEKTSQRTLHQLQSFTRKNKSAKSRLTIRTRLVGIKKRQVSKLWCFHCYKAKYTGIARAISSRMAKQHAQHRVRRVHRSKTNHVQTSRPTDLKRNRRSDTRHRITTNRKPNNKRK